MKNKLLVSFSGGETSAYMAQWLWNHKQDEYEMIFVFANTGQENEETLKFVRDCESLFNFKCVWIEAGVFHNQRKGNGFKIVDYISASREGEPFEEIIKKHGIPNMSTPHCTRELKQAPIKAYAKSIGWKKYYTAIGIREDEIDRMSSKRKESRLLYPLISMIPMTKQKINFWWSQQPFRLNLKGYQGNCVTCWKKSDNKLYQIAKENEYAFNFFGKMEARYGNYIPESRLKLMESRNELPKLPSTFFRKNRSAIDIVNESKVAFNHVVDDSAITPQQQDLFSEQDYDEHCEVYAQCGVDN